MALTHILVPVDLETDDSYAARYGMSVASLFDARVTLLHVASWQTTGVVAVEPIYMPQGLVARLEAERMDIIGKKLAKLTAELGDTGDVSLTTDVKRGFAPDGIVHYAEENDVDLIVMESRSTLGGGFLLGGTADKVSRAAPCPVLIAPPSATDDPAKLKSALVTIDYSAFSLPAATLAAKLVGAGGAVELIHVWQPPFLPNLDAHLTGCADELHEAVEKQRNAQADGLTRIAAQIDVPGVSIDSYLAEGSPAREILRRAEELGPDLLVLGAHSRERLTEKVRGTVADRVLRHASCPVLMVPAAALESL